MSYKIEVATITRWSYYRGSYIYRGFTVQLIIFQSILSLYNNNIQPHIMMIVSNLIYVYNGYKQQLYIHMYIYRTLRGRDQRKKCALNFIKYTLSRPTASSTTKSALLHRKECFIRSIKHSLRCNKALFVGNKAQLPTCLSVG